MARATGERIPPRSPASSRPENSSHGTVSRGATTDTETETAAGAAAAASACALPLRPLRKLAPAAIANAATTSDAPTKCLFLMILFMEDPQLDRTLALRPRFEQTASDDDTRSTPTLQRTHS